MKSPLRYDDRQSWKHHPLQFFVSYSQSSSGTLPAVLLASESNSGLARPRRFFPSGRGGLPEADYESGRTSNCVVHHQDYNGTDDSHH